MRREDLPQVMEIENASYTAPWPEASFRGLLRRPDAAIFVAENEGEIVGYAASWAVLDQGELGNIAVAPGHRGQGVAKRLMDAVIEEMRERGVHELYLEVRVTNTVAQHLYEQYGFVEIGCRPNYYTSPIEDAIVMRRRIERPDSFDST